MAQPSLLLRFRLDLSDVDRGIYESLDFRIAQHPSETQPFLLARVLAYALNYTPDLTFSPGGLSDTDVPCLTLANQQGGYDTCIEVGSPSAKRIHKLMKASRHVKIYCYRDPRPLLREFANEGIHRFEELEVYAFEPGFLNQLASHLEKDNRWSVMHTDGSLTVSVGQISVATEIVRQKNTLDSNTN